MVRTKTRRRRKRRRKNQRKKVCVCGKDETHFSQTACLEPKKEEPKKEEPKKEEAKKSDSDSESDKKKKVSFCVSIFTTSVTELFAHRTIPNLRRNLPLNLLPRKKRK